MSLESRVLWLIAFWKLLVELVKSALEVVLTAIGIVEAVIVIIAVVVSSTCTSFFPGSTVGGLLTYFVHRCKLSGILDVLYLSIHETR